MSVPVTPAPGLPRLLAGVHHGRSIDLVEHQERFGPLPWFDHGDGAAALIETVARSGLQGRGGGGFSAGKKMRAVAASPYRAMIVANGAEGEPASQKDGFLLTGSPHLVLDGIAIAAAAVEADWAVICLKQQALDAVAAISGAIEEREMAGAEGVCPEISLIPGGYVAGEESALVDHLNGGPGKPGFVPPRPFERGVGGRPTLILNVETLASIALISRFGESWNRSLGTSEDPGSILITMAGAVVSPGVYEIGAGTPLTKVLKAAGGPSEPLQAFLIGGYGGTWKNVESALQLPLGHTALQAAGANLGPGVIAALPAAACGVIEMARVARYLAEESAGQCGPCLHGLPAIAELLERIGGGEADPGAHERIEQWAHDISGRGACHHPDGAVRLITSGLEVFTAEVALHERHHRCSAETDRANILPLAEPQALESELA
jgi:NADH:ubiquinone oxidoreductase subunit F (NADH-binding)